MIRGSKNRISEFYDWAARSAGAAFLSIALYAAAFAQERAVSRTVKGEAAKDVRIGVYINVGADCKSGPLPTVRVVSHPKDGKVTLKKGRISATNYKQCLAMQVPGYVVFYRSRPEFSGTDTLILEVAFTDGRIETQNIKVMVEAHIPTRGI